ncbi:chemotaxis protein MotA [Altererythrobacter xixiisoli]|uniref:Chemotaxis protein MotA n=1 Tax=Croceibacterium xixiisoli TaxID=1476466 RepID=A0A6I4TT19_9SPHN|nr:MotA/TolQ/ExbB proton channel family protein [Croceibacterium xixiisoli]MXO98479.1 chemotaxis protein MotA [Croceibacterium xixiisoli]
MDWLQWFNPVSVAIVAGGTLCATFLRSGLHDTGLALKAIRALFSAGFDSSRTKAELAIQIQDIGTEGILRAEPHHFGDGEFDHIADALIGKRSVRALYDEHERYRAARQIDSDAAVGVLNSATELAPVLGLGGTLLSLGNLSTVAAQGNYAAAIGMAVTTTLYGLLLGNFLFAPLAFAIARRAAKEERERQELLDWLAAAVEPACHPQTMPAAIRPPRKSAA